MKDRDATRAKNSRGSSATARTSNRSAIPGSVVGKLAMIIPVPTIVVWQGVFLLALLGVIDRFGVSGQELFFRFFGLHCVMSLFGLGTLVWYMFAAGTTPRLDSTMRLVWILVIFQASFLAMPVFWYLYVWRQPPPTTMPTASSVPTSSP